MHSEVKLFGHQPKNSRSAIRQAYSKVATRTCQAAYALLTSCRLRSRCQICQSTVYTHPTRRSKAMLDVKTHQPSAEVRPARREVDTNFYGRRSLSRVGLPALQSSLQIDSRSRWGKSTIIARSPCTCWASLVAKQRFRLVKVASVQSAKVSKARRAWFCTSVLGDTYIDEQYEALVIQEAGLEQACCV